jgi:hypothetical protein
MSVVPFPPQPINAGCDEAVQSVTIKCIVNSLRTVEDAPYSTTTHRSSPMTSDVAKKQLRNQKQDVKATAPQSGLR